MAVYCCTQVYAHTNNYLQGYKKETEKCARERGGVAKREHPTVAQQKTGPDYRTNKGIPL